MLFRPEEVHGTSGVADVFEPFEKRNRDVGIKVQGVFIEHLAVFHLKIKFLTAIQAGKVHPHLFSGEKPADRQRFKASLAVPFLLAVDGYPILGGQVVERGKGGDVVGVGIQPAGNAGSK